MKMLRVLKCMAVVVAGDIEDHDGLGTADGGKVRMRKDYADLSDGLPLGIGEMELGIV